MSNPSDRDSYLVDASCAADFPAVMELLRQLWPTTTLDPLALREVYERGLDAKNQVYMCARTGDHVVGFGTLTIKNNFWQAGFLGHIDELIIDTAFRNRGIGTALLRELTTIAQKRGCRRIELDSGFHRAEAHAFYEAQGFEKRGIVLSKLV